MFVDDVEVTALGAGLGMDPFDLFVPRNRLIAADEPRRVPIARCTCGDYGCGATDVVIARDGDRVHWEWHEQKPVEQGVTFAATGCGRSDWRRAGPPPTTATRTSSGWRSRSTRTTRCSSGPMAGPHAA